MSQSAVLELLRALGHHASTKEIAALAKKRFPELSLHTYVGLRLRQLQKWQVIDKDAKGLWYIRDGSA